MMKKEIVVTLNYKPIDKIFREGGVAWLPTSKLRRDVKYVICVRNTRGSHSNFGPNGRHGTAYFIGEVDDYVDVHKENKPPNKKRATWRGKITLKRYAKMNDELLWKPQTNPMKYTSLESLQADGHDINFNTLDWLEFPRSIDIEEEAEAAITENEVKAITKEEAHAGLAKYYGVDVEKIKLTVELI